MPSPLLDNISKIFDFAVKNEANIDTVFRYLAKFGYIDPQKETSIESIIHAIIQLHNMAGIQTNGTISAKTLQVMSWPRCGCKDIQAQTENIGRLPKWGKNNLTYGINGHGNPVTQDQWNAAIRQALNNHQAVCNVTFTETNYGMADINISMGQGPADQFDGPSGVLAWCELPPTTNFNGQLQSKGDLSETWLPIGGSGRGILIVNTFCHELGHGLGLSHTNVPNSLMNPFYNIAIDKPQADDISQLVARYGQPVSQPTVPSNPQIPATPNPSELIIRIKGNATVSIDGYRISKIN